MKDVREITLCKDVSLGYEPIIGMQLRYASGHRACLGQFRFDMALETLQIYPGDSLYISSRRNKKQFFYVAKVTAHLPADHGELSWVEIDNNSNLEWWFSTCHSIVRTGGAIYPG